MGIQTKPADCYLVPGKRVLQKRAMSLYVTRVVGDGFLTG